VTVLPEWPLLLAFLAASFVLAVTPGPGVFYIVTRSLAQGRVAGLASVAGIALGNLGCAISASLGLAAVLAVSSAAFAVVKYAGAAYLIYLGVQALRERPEVPDASVVTKRVRPQRLFHDGFLVALLNPKTALFFGAFLPQFLDAGTSPALQSVLLGALFVAIAAVTDSAYALCAAAIGRRFETGTGFAAGRYLTATAFFGLGLLTAFSGSRPGTAP
jgi:threonine/homoserine/homoserine lactone efflux protein